MSLDIENMTERLNTYFDSPEAQEDVRKYKERLDNEQAIFDSQIERLHKVYTDEFVEKVLAKYGTKEYTDRWYKRGIFPPEDLLFFLYEHAQRYGRELTKKESLKISMFTSDAFIYGQYMFEFLFGQGCAIKITKTLKPFYPKSRIEKKENINKMTKAEKEIEKAKELLIKNGCFAKVWSLEDIIMQSKKLIFPKLSAEQAKDIAKSIVGGHDATVGINWDVIDSYIQEYANENGIAEIEQYILPERFSNAIMNGVYDGLTGDEITDLMKFIEVLGVCVGFEEDEPFFARTNDLYKVGDNVLTFNFITN